jgi:hypothetical protein
MSTANKSKIGNIPKTQKLSKATQTYVINGIDFNILIVSKSPIIYTKEQLAYIAKDMLESAIRLNATKKVQ